LVIFLVYNIREGGIRITDERLIETILAGDEQAFMDFVSLYGPFLFAVIFPIIREQHSAEDVLQETFLQIYRSLPQYQHKGLKTWLARIATNKAIDWKRKNAAQKIEHLTEDMDVQVTDWDPSQNQPETVQLQWEERTELLEACKGLPTIYQETIEKYYYQGKTYVEIAQEEKISVKTVESRLYRAKQLLKRSWEEGKDGTL